MFFKKNIKNCYIFGKNARNKWFKSKYKQFSATFEQIFAFPTSGTGLMNKYLAQNKVYSNFNIGGAKTLIKLKEK